MAQRIAFGDIPLEQEQRDLLALMVEAQRSVPREAWHEYLYEPTFGGSYLGGPGLNYDGVVRSDLDTLAEWGFLRPGYGSRGARTYDITPTGRRYYEWMKLEQGEPAERVEVETRHHLEDERFRAGHPRAYERWAEADSLLWGAGSESAFTQIGLLCREAMQHFASDLVEGLSPDEVDPDPEHVENRIRVAREARRAGPLGKRHRDWLSALVAYWRTVSDLAQRQVHGSKKAGKPLTWEDARRVNFQTLVAMTEIERAIRGS
jgi:hypothetical protein